MRTTATGPAPVKGTAYYDPERSLLIGLHYDGDADTPPLGVLAQTVDISIQQ